MAKKRAMGDCFRWAYQYVENHPDAMLYQGRVVAPYKDAGPEPYDHAWVTHNGIVKDWQTMVAGFGGKYRGRGWPEADWLHYWRPHKAKAYNAAEAQEALSRNRHYGPWS